MITILYEERKSAMKKFNDNIIANLKKLEDVKTIEIKTLKYKNKFIKEIYNTL